MGGGGDPQQLPRHLNSGSSRNGCWIAEAGWLIAPDGVRIDLSDLDLAVMERFDAGRGLASDARITLCHHLGRPVSEEPDNTLSAIIYRLRRRIRTRHREPGAAAGAVAVGYVFRRMPRSA